ncbi:hypothetical protein [Parapedobacter indicus]|uniref:Uncharacterized protein n=1 Tax=Parapedobacter indicus TaxID=1477437 RepID=A0A1I3CXT3_9SPHI|nr:hypothetical protein [Parapedobacter indicus]PPL04436.1 hypothetical protein CLV26_101238 [Parapedobacter indicus]SFH79069.1 hypothetical protein SAMN05444682_101225 [Parapedobacter indicus]
MNGFSLHTTDPTALRYLMTETIFGIEEPGADGPDQEAAVPTATPNTSLQFAYHGGNKRNLLFLTHETQYEWMSAAALDAFTKTLAALKLSTDDIALLNVGKLSEIPEKSHLLAFFNPKVVVALGASLPWDESDGLTVFKTYSFDEMLVDAEKKRLFWTTLKTLLG